MRIKFNFDVSEESPIVSTALIAILITGFIYLGLRALGA